MSRMHACTQCMARLVDAVNADNSYYVKVNFDYPPSSNERTGDPRHMLFVMDDGHGSMYGRKQGTHTIYRGIISHAPLATNKQLYDNVI